MERYDRDAVDGAFPLNEALRGAFDEADLVGGGGGQIEQQDDIERGVGPGERFDGDGLSVVEEAEVVADVDAGQAAFQSPASLAGTYGTFTFNTATGQWGYTLDNSRSATQALRAGDEVQDRLTVLSHDGTATRTIEVRGEQGTAPFVVKFDDGHETVVYPGGDVVVERSA